MDSTVLAEIGIVILVWLLFPNRFAAINLFFLTIGLLTIYFTQPYVSAYVGQREHKKMAFRQIEEIDLIIPVASSLKSTNPTVYEELIRDVTANQFITAELTEQESILSAYQAVLRQFSRFFAAAFDVDIIRYIEAHLKFISQLNQIDPHSVLQFSYPNLFGLLEFDSLIKASNRFEYHKAVRITVDSGKYFFGAPPPHDGEYFYKRFFIKFKIKHPAEASVIGAAYTAQTKAHRQFLANALVLFYSEVSRLPQKEACDIWRYMLTHH